MADERRQLCRPAARVGTNTPAVGAHGTHRGGVLPTRSRSPSCASPRRRRGRPAVLAALAAATWLIAATTPAAQGQTPIPATDTATATPLASTTATTTPTATPL